MIARLLFLLVFLAGPAFAEPIEAPGPAGPLRGTLLAAAAGAPAVLIIPGSGPTDRDGNNPLGVKAATYRLLAEGLAAEGVATVRTDKRGLFGSKGAVADADAVDIADYAADTHGWVTVMRSRLGVACVWLLGHSEGGLIALVAARQPEGICGLVLAATAGRPLAAVLRDQLRANPANAPLLDQALAAVDALEAGRRVDTAGLHPALLGLFRPSVQGFMISVMSCDPATLLRGWQGPALILQGESDLQVGVADARLLAAADPRARLVLLPRVNHVLKVVASDDVAANRAAYADPGLPLAPGIVAAIAGFVKAPR
jgi:pimeloyl-ACP methyl ester carboxylesterase